MDRRGLAELIDRLGYVQVDSINTVERAHHMILLARSDGYRRRDFERLLHDDRALFENWTHDAAVIPSAYFRYWQLRFEREHERMRERWRLWHGSPFEAVVDEVRERVSREGPLLARELAEPRAGGAAGGWWQWHPSKAALEFLWRTGELAVARREGFQKVYDLVERVIPDQHRPGGVDHEALVEWACRSAFARMGFATSGEMAAFWASITKQEAAAWCARQRGGELVEVEIEGWNGAGPRVSLMPAAMLERLDDLPEPPRRVRLLSPFDPLIRDRRRLEHVFGFDYRIEVFVPEARRKYGYYVFPLLEGDRLVGRIDMKHDRACGTINVTGLWWEKGVRRSKARDQALEADIARIGRFIGAERIAFADGYQRGSG